MFKNKTFVILAVVILLSISVVILMYRMKSSTNKKTMTKEISPVIGDIILSVSTTGVIEPQNRLEIKPSISGRIEEILVQEGDRVKKGDTLVWMSSTERAALIDAARSQGADARKYWEQVYKRTPIISPIKGEVIVRSVEPGQTVTAGDTVLVLSDRLIINAQFDETDIGRVEVRQKAVISLDAYPNVKINGFVDHIAYESELVNNVTIYDVDIVPQEVPQFFRSGMSANVEVIENEHKGVLMVPLEAIDKEGGRSFVWVKKTTEDATEKREVQTGVSDERNVVIRSGLSADDIIVVKEQTYLPQKGDSGTNPFMPFRRRKK